MSEPRRVTLTEAEADRFGRNVLLAEIGLGGQEVLRGAVVRLASLDAAGSAAALYLAAAGVGGLVLEDTRPVAPADLAGTLYRAVDVGTPRAEAARRALAALDPGLGLDMGPPATALLVDARLRDDGVAGCALAVDRAEASVRAAGAPGPQALLAGSLAALETVKLLLGLGAPVRAEALP